LVSSKAKTIFILTLLVALLPVGTRGAEAGNRPSPRFGHRMVYDPVNERILLFGGAVYENRYTFFDDLWAYDYASNTWTEIDCGPGPSGRFNFMMVYLTGHNQVLLFGGFSATDRVSDTWVYDITDNRWFRVSTDNSPSPRSDAAIVYDGRNDVVILSDGYCRDDSHPRDTWVFDFDSIDWTRMDPEDSPLPQYGHHMVYDSANDQVVMYGGHWSTQDPRAHGYSDGVWVYDYPTDSWTKVDEATSLPSRYWHQMAYDGDRGNLVVFSGSMGGDSRSDDTWLLDTDEFTWERLDSEVSPEGRANSAMVYDSARQKVILFGGLKDFGDPPLGDLWVLDPVEGAWEEIGAEVVDVDEEQQEEEDNAGTGIPGFPAASLLTGLLTSIAFLALGSQHREG
jgi:N-acetylneuraminic acid mutarotase